jgi:transposase
VHLLFLSSYSPEFSAIENLFGYLKNQLKDVRFNNKEILANIITAFCKKIT